MARGKRISTDIDDDALASIRAMGAAARQARTAAGEGQAAAAERLGVHVQTIARIESGEPGVAVAHVVGLLALYGLSIEPRRQAALRPPRALAGAPAGHRIPEIPMLVFRQLFDPVSSTYTYLLGDPVSGEALLIDPVFENVRRDTALLRELGLRCVATLDTHVHADHVTGAWLMKAACGSRIMLSEASGATNADRLLKHGDRVAFGDRHVEVRATPGHTNGCVTYVLDDGSMAFTGDSLLIRGCGRTDFQQGSPERLYHSVKEQILSLPPACLLYPGHDYRGLTVTSVAEEQRYNPRLGGDVDEADFAGYMNHLGLPHPKLMDIAVPANLRCGQPDAAAAPAPEPTWAPLSCNFGGVWEIAPQALLERMAGDRAGDVQLVDVREPAEFVKGLGHIPGARLIPLAELVARSGELDRAKPAVMVCRSGARSAQATVLLQKNGFTQVANLAGGMLRWRAEALPYEQGTE
jgi:glyoxylase-like metal-dependent hydrolase (beta-lactamase superfamily II)/rhodanese-related sulfurtransferase